MWIQFNNCFFSIIEDDTNPANVWVRARRKGDLEKLFHEFTPFPEVIHTPDRDYLYRLSLPKGVVGATLLQKVMEIDYHNFKGSVEDRELEKVYFKVWDTLQAADDRY